MLTWLKNKNQVNLVIDTAMFLVLMAVAGLGLLMKYVLIPGYKRVELYENDVEFYFLGLTRHDWGNVHLWLGFIFLFLLLLHIILHWNIIVCIFRQMVSGRNMRTILAIAIGTAGLFLLLSPLFIKPETGLSTRKYRHRFVPSRSQDSRYNSTDFYRKGQEDKNYTPRRFDRYDRGERYEPGKSEQDRRDVYTSRRYEQWGRERYVPPRLDQGRGDRYFPPRFDQGRRDRYGTRRLDRGRRDGYGTRRFDQGSIISPGGYPSNIIRVTNNMTLDEVSENYNISVKELAKELNLPDTETHEKIVTLRREYSFLLSDVRKAVIKLQKE